MQRQYLIVVTVDAPASREERLDDIVMKVIEFSTARDAIEGGLAAAGAVLTGFYQLGDSIPQYEPVEWLEPDEGLTS